MRVDANPDKPHGRAPRRGLSYSGMGINLPAKRLARNRWQFMRWRWRVKFPELESGPGLAERD